MYDSKLLEELEQEIDSKLNSVNPMISTVSDTIPIIAEETIVTNKSETFQKTDKIFGKEHNLLLLGNAILSLQFFGFCSKFWYSISYRT